LEFRSTLTSVEIHVDAPDAQDEWFGLGKMSQIETGIEITIFDKGKKILRAFQFTSEVVGTDSTRLRGRIPSSYISLPCELIINGEQDIELSAPVEIFAERISLRSPTLILRQLGGSIGGSACASRSASSRIQSH
jgi:hypothetical protein